MYVCMYVCMYVHTHTQMSLVTIIKFDLTIYVCEFNLICARPNIGTI
jgi:hypothetical protein